MSNTIKKIAQINSKIDFKNGSAIYSILGAIKK